MVGKKQVLAASAAFVGAGTSLVALPEPASAHSTSIRFRDATAEVNANHVGIYVCNLTRGYYAAGQYRRGDGTISSTPPVAYGECEWEPSTGGIASYRLCVYNVQNPSVCSAWKRT